MIFLILCVLGIRHLIRLKFLLNNTPIIPDFGKIEKDYEKFNNYVEKNKTDKGIYLKRILYGLKVKKREV